MRATLALALVLGILLAGCAKPAPTDDASASTPTSTGAGPGTGAARSPSPSPSAAPSPSTSSSSPQYDASYMGYYPHDFGSAPSSQTLRVPANAPKVDVDLGFWMMPSMSASCDTGGARIILEGPTAASRMQLDAGTRCATAKNWTNVSLAAGAWTLRFEGQGSGNGFATIGPHGSSTKKASEPFHAKKTHDYLNAEETQKIVVPEGAGSGTITLKLAPGDATTGCFSTDASIDVIAPDGRSVAKIALAAPPTLPNTCPPTKRADGVALAPGTWKVAFAGSGSVQGTVEMTAS